MTRKDYELIAQVLATNRPRPSMYIAINDYKAAKHIHDSIVSDLADELQWDNPAFNRAKFVEACGM